MHMALEILDVRSALRASLAWTSGVGPRGEEIFEK